MIIRAATEADSAPIAAITKAAFEAAFGRSDEADLIAALRRDGDVLVDLVAEEDGDIIGHILFSRLEIKTSREALAAAALAPVSVKPCRQKAGIGGALIRHGVEACRALNLSAILVLGHPAYYPKFGFTAQAAKALTAPFSGDHFMALELKDGALRDGGVVRYAAAFGV